LLGNEDNDVISVNDSAAQSLFAGGQGDDQITISSDFINSTITGNDGDDSLTPVEGSSIAGSIVLGNAGDDYLDLSEAEVITASLFHGGQDDDTLDLGGGDYYNDRRSYYGDGPDEITSSQFFGGDGNDEILLPGSYYYGGYSLASSQDTISSFTVTDSLFSGGAGNDLIGEDSSFDEVQPNNSWNGSFGGEYTGVTFEGNQGNDEIYVFAKVFTDSQFYGGQDNDTIAVWAYDYKSDEEQRMLSNNVTIEGNKGDDVIASYLIGASDVFIFGGQDNDTIMNYGSNAYIEGGIGDDSIVGYEGNDSLPGGDTILGGDGNDTVVAGDKNDLIDGGAGDDSILGGYGDDDITGGDGNDYIMGEKGDDIITGGIGNDKISGGKGIDTIIGGEGADDYLPDAGTDIYNILAISESAAATSGTVRTFDRFTEAGSFTSGDDKLSITAAMASTLGGGVSPGMGAITEIKVNGDFADFAALKTALDLQNVAASTPSSIVSYTFTITGAIAGSYLWIQDNQSQYDQRDLMFQIASADQFKFGDIVIG
jgi:Ca2+-binding RTX toxin-like protein